MGLIPRLSSSLAAALVVCSALACGAGAAFSPAAERFAKGPAPKGPGAPQSACDSLASCQEECDAVETSTWGSACGRAASRLYQDSSRQAQRLWLEACRQRDALACQRLMAVTASNPRLADSYARHACRYGSASACHMFGIVTALRGLSQAGDKKRRRQLLGRATIAFELGCGRGHWLSCVWAANLYERAGNAEAAAKERRDEAVVTASRGCDQGLIDACAFVGRGHEAAGRMEQAKAVYAKSCAGLVTQWVGGRPEPAMLWQYPVCQRAKDLGVAPEPIEWSPPRAPGVAIASPILIRQHRTEGEDEIIPPDSVTQVMYSQKKTLLSARVLLCISDTGLVDSVELERSSTFAAYDQVIIESVRAWRYRPFLLGDKAIPICAHVELGYRQQNTY